jgi:type IV pilus assembly protein PilQ
MKRTSKTNTGSTRVRRLRLGVLAALLGASSGVLAAGSLDNISFAAGPGGRVDITLALSEPATEVPVFTTEDPPRIIIDLPDTRNAVPQRRIPVGIGATSAIATAEAAGRTRVSVDLFRSTPYETRVEGKTVVLMVGGASTTAPQVNAYAADPAKRTGNLTEVANIDFRRTPQGTGRIILGLAGEGAASEMRVDGQRVRVDLAGVFLPESMVKRLDVSDFATPVQSVALSRSANGTRLDISINGAFEPLAYQSGNEFVVEVDPVQAAVVGADGVVVEGAQPGYSGKPVTFNFQDIPVRTVLQLIAEESGLNIVAADSVTGNVTLRLINVPWDQALDLVLRAKSLDQRRDRNVIWVAPQSEIASYEKAIADARIAQEQRAELVSEYIAINYGSAEEIAKLLTDQSKGNQQGGQQQQQQQGMMDSRGFLSPRGSVTFDKRTNTLLLNDLPDKIAEIKRLIALLDRPVDQVLIEARIVIASEDFARELGAKFGVTGADQSSSGRVITTSGSQAANHALITNAVSNRYAGRNTISNIGDALTVGPLYEGRGIGPERGDIPSPASRLGVNLPVNNPAGSIGFAILSADYLVDLELSALQSEGRGELVSSPRVITANQREASIKQGDEIGYVTTTGTGAAAQITTEFKEIVLELLVTPTITQDDRVYLTLRVKKDELAGFTSSPIGDIPLISKREINTAVLVDNGQTVVIGGVYEFTSREDLRKVPFLGDVPILGNLFRTKRNGTEKAELLIFVTPKVLAVSGRPAR